MSAQQANDDIPRYSTPALSALNEFHDCECMVFVEGKDDEIFWEMICECADLITNTKIESVGGKPQLDEHIEKILTDSAPIIVACDSDYDVLLKISVEHPQIVHTYGYSIENTMYCPSSLSRFVRKLARSRNDFTLKAQVWLDEFCNTCRPLLVYDVANKHYAKGISVLGDTCGRFLASRHAEKLSPSKIDEFVNKIRGSFSDLEIKHSQEIIANDPRPLTALVKGHFISLGVLNWTKKQVAKRHLTISNEHLYTGTIDSCKVCMTTGCRQLGQMCDALTAAFEAVRLANKTKPGTNNGSCVNNEVAKDNYM